MYTYDTRVTASATGDDGLQTAFSTVTMMQDCSMLWMESEPDLVAYLERNNTAMMVASRQVDFLRRPRYGEKLQVRTSIYKLHGRMGYRNTVIVDEQGEYTAVCWAIGVFVTYDTGRMIPIPPEIEQTITFDPKIDMEYLRRKIVLPKVDPVACTPVTVQRSDLDFNHHMNNAQYVRIAYDMLPDDFAIRRLRIMHEGQARAGQVIHPQLLVEEGRRVYSLNADDGSPYAIIEWS